MARSATDKRQARRKALMKSTEKEKGGFGKPLYPNYSIRVHDILDRWVFSPVNNDKR